MAEHRRIPEVERLEGRDMPAVLGVPYAAPPVHLAATHAHVSPQVAVLAPTTQSAAEESPEIRAVASPSAAGASSHPFAAVWQLTDAFSTSAADGSDSVTTAWTQPPALEADAATNGVTAAAHEACAAGTVAQPAPTMVGVLRYAWKSVNRYRIDDRDDAVQQICLEWLLLAATIQTTYDDVRRIVARVLNRVFRRLKKHELPLELLDVAVHTDPVQETLRDMQLDRDLGVNDLTDREWQVIRMRGQGCTFVEIGRQLGIPRQRACELFAAAASSLRQRYCKTFQTASSQRPSSASR